MHHRNFCHTSVIVQEKSGVMAMVANLETTGHKHPVCKYRLNKIQRHTIMYRCNRQDVLECARSTTSVASYCSVDCPPSLQDHGGHSRGHTLITSKTVIIRVHDEIPRLSIVVGGTITFLDMGLLERSKNKSRSAGVLRDATVDNPRMSKRKQQAKLSIKHYQDVSRGKGGGVTSRQ